MKKGNEIIVLDGKVRIQNIQKADYISITDIAKYKNADDPRFIIQN